MTRNRNANRLVWNDSFSNDSSLWSNKEPYKKKCNKCKADIWMNPSNGKWQGLGLDGKPHECIKEKPAKKKSTEKPEKKYRRKCEWCETELLMRKHNKGWKAYEINNGAAHRCTKRNKTKAPLTKVNK